ncbi:MAG: pknB 20 [Planctomycetaceae bacterium]|nr:pknB 20 [Planctomycetaceae bacterium]
MTDPADNLNAQSDLSQDILKPGDWTHSAFFREHAPRLEALIRARLAPRFRSRFDADDVVQSAFRSFFLRPAPAHSVLSKETDLWPLLAEIAVRKLAQQIRRHQAQRRDVRADRLAEDNLAVLGVGPDDAASLAEIIERVQLSLDAKSREAFLLRLQGHEILEIAEHQQISERTVRRQLVLAKQLLQRLLDLEPTTDEIKHATTEGHPSFAPLHFSDYRLHQWIGDGASGNVYRASEKATGRTVAIKFLKKQFLFQPRWVDSFLREVQMVSRLQHPGIISIHGLGKTPNRGFFLVMDWAPEGDLTRYAAAKRVPLTQICRWILELTTALQHAHQNGVIHCDLKPGNVLIGSHGQLLLSDFGFARRSLTSPDNRLNDGGTPAYIAPELVDPAWGEIGPATDVFGLGAILFNLLTGRPPHDGPNLEVVLRQAVSAAPVVWPSLADCDIPTHWREFGDRLLAKKVSDRWPDMAAVHWELETLSRTI